jgi:hypothetical protein
MVDIMELTITTPAIFFPTISLLMVAYTNRYLALARRIRELGIEYRDQHVPSLKAQIGILRKRVMLIRAMQGLGLSALLFCVICMLMFFLAWMAAAKIAFVCALILLIGAISISLYEVMLSTRALDLSLQEMESEE